MTLLRQLLAIASLAATLAFPIGGSPTLKPIDQQYIEEGFIVSLAIEQFAYPASRMSYTTPQALDCMTSLFVNLLPGVEGSNIFWNMSTVHYTWGIWNSEETTYIQFELDYVPQNIAYAASANGNVPGWNGVYKNDPNCRDCWDNPQTVYLQFKDLITNYVTNKQFLYDLMHNASGTNTWCSENFKWATFAYVAVSQPDAEWLGTNPKRPGHNLGYQYLWILLGLLIPISYGFYQAYLASGWSSLVSKYDADRELEMSGESNNNDSGGGDDSA